LNCRMTSGQDRFSKVLKDPKFKTISQKTTKVEIDDRFAKMFTGKHFNEKRMGEEIFLLGKGGC